jgi:SP family general alpha glucoside:H+ symporter-like MFS transporter
MMAGKNAKILDGKYVSAWGGQYGDRRMGTHYHPSAHINAETLRTGIQSAGQFVGQILLPFITNRFGRKPAMYAIWIVLVVSIAIETVTSTYWHWLIAKLFAGVGVGCIQATLPVYIGEHSPNQLRGFLINAYTL